MITYTVSFYFVIAVLMYMLLVDTPMNRLLSGISGIIYRYAIRLIYMFKWKILIWSGSDVIREVIQIQEGSGISAADLTDIVDSLNLNRIDLNRIVIHSASYNAYHPGMWKRVTREQWFSGRKKTLLNDGISLSTVLMD